MLSAIHRQAHEKATHFERVANPHALARQPGPIEMDVSPSGGFKKMSYRRVQFKPTVDMTLTQIYQGFRTSPVGALSVKGALHEAGTFALKGIGAYFGYGYAAGTLVSELIQHFAPDVHMAIGEFVHNAFEYVAAIFGGPPPAFLAPYQISILGTLQQESALSFSLSTTETWLLSAGGDYNVNQEWAAISGSGGGSSPCDPEGGCPILL